MLRTLALASDRLEDILLVLRWDTLFGINYLDLGLTLHRSPAVAAGALTRPPDCRGYGWAPLAGRWVVAFEEKTQSKEEDG